MDSSSVEKMKGVDERLVRVVELAYSISPRKFKVTEGLRTPERQKLLFAEKKTKTLKSKHLLGKAVDIVIILDTGITWDMKYYKEVAGYMKQAAKQLNVQIECGADWGWDGPHIELKD